MKNWQGSTFFRKFSFNFSAIVWIIFGNCSIVRWKALSVTFKVQKTITFQIKYPFVDLIFISFHLKLNSKSLSQSLWTRKSSWKFQNSHPNRSGSLHSVSVLGHLFADIVSVHNRIRKHVHIIEFGYLNLLAMLQNSTSILVQTFAYPSWY